MPRFIYSLILYLSVPLVLLFVALKSITDARYRYRLKDRLGFCRKSSHKPVIWCHVASVGEVLLALPLFNKMLEYWPDYDFFVSTQTPSGHQTLIDKLGSKITPLLVPIDTPDAVKRAVKRINPSLFIVFETELWPNLLQILHRKRVPLILLNGRISSKSLRKYRFFRTFLKPILDSFSALCMQSTVDAENVISLGAPIENVMVTGNLKFDRVLTYCPGELKSLIESKLTGPGRSPLLVLGSIHDSEFAQILDVYNVVRQTFSNLKMIIAPRHLENLPQLEDELQNHNITTFRRSQSEKISESTLHSPDGMILDTYGELSSVYSLASIVFVGGSMTPHGGQNMLEPAYFKKPVFFGPYVSNFKDISSLLIESGGAKMVNDSRELQQYMIELLQDTDKQRIMGEAGFSVIDQHRGATVKALKIIESILSNGM